MQDTFEEVKVGAIVFAGGYECYNPRELYELGYGRLPNVVTSIEFERILSALAPSRASCNGYLTEFLHRR